MNVHNEEVNSAPDNEKLARRIFIAFCIASTLFMVLVVLIGTMLLTD